MPIYKFTTSEEREYTFIVNRLIIPDGNTMIGSNHRYMGTVNIWHGNYVQKTEIKIRIVKGYSWDGCSPKFKIGNSIVGIWDGNKYPPSNLPECYNASLIHDFLLQFKDQHKIPLNTTNDLFYEQLTKDNFFLAPLYYLAVKIFFSIKSLFNLR